MKNLHPLQQIGFTRQNMAYVVEASAGTGKTWTIERLFIKALLEASMPENPSIPITIENILLVTFTNDATDELKSRISEQLEVTVNQIIYLRNCPPDDLTTTSDPFIAYLIERIKVHDPAKDITILNRALQNFDQAAIYTIHGFCNKLLHDYPFECKVNTDFELVATNSTHLHKLVNDFMHSAIMTNDNLAPYLDVVMYNLEMLFVDRHQQTDLITAIVGKLPKDLFTLDNNEYVIKYQLVATTPSLSGLTDGELRTNNNKQRTVKAEFLAYLINYLANKYPVLSATSSQISYDELIQKVADAIRHNQLLADKIYALFPIAFIDEFQDTDALQWQIFSSIYRLEGIKRGNVVVVGDPKQAIYHFRGADVDTYLWAREQINNSLQLTSNFRSHPHIMNFINQLFTLQNQGVSPATSFFGSGIDYNSVTAKGAINLSLPTANELTALCTSHNINASFDDAQVHLVAINGISKDIRQEQILMALTFEILALLNKEPALAGKIAILVTKNREATEIVNYLARYGLRASELKLGNIYSTAIAEDVYQFLTALFDLTNRSEFMRALGSSLFNLPLAQLKTTQAHNSTLGIWQQRFFKYQAIWVHEGIISLIYALLKDLAANSTTKDVILTRRSLANLWQLGELLHLKSRKVANSSELLFWFKNKITDAKDGLTTELDSSNEEVIRLDNDDEQIIITTQHKAKGLEYEILFCPYFKSGNELDGMYDYNYRRPFFSTFRENSHLQSHMVMDETLGQKIVASDNKEVHRLNYVALTRAKSRLYIYLKQPTITKTSGKYNPKQRPDKLTELFGYIAANPQDRSHRLFKYPDFFGHNPHAALKDPTAFPGVVAYNRNSLSLQDLDKLRLSRHLQTANYSAFRHFSGVYDGNPGYYRQSYTSLIKSAAVVDSYQNDYFVIEDVTGSPVSANETATEISYRYQVLADPNLSGANFGVLFHALCENYPLTDIELTNILLKHNIGSTSYHHEFKQMLEEAFNYKLIGELRLGDIQDFSQTEMEFNLLIKQQLGFKDELAKIIEKYFGATHQFYLAITTLTRIEPGFLGGFIDVCFLYQGKYWVLDYKTNKLSDYTAPTDVNSSSNTMLGSMAEHHYYLQYLLYLVAIKRYLEQQFKLLDASDLLGGAIYFYVRAVYVTTPQDYSGIYVDDKCQNLVHEIDMLLKGSK